jgi:predicted TIM-barrel fold metal-dependent hydrolase
MNSDKGAQPVGVIRRENAEQYVRGDFCDAWHPLRDFDLSVNGGMHARWDVQSAEVQSVIDSRKATELARSANEYASSVIKKHPSRFSAFAAIASQDPKSAASELERAVRQFGFKGALINGYSNVGPNESVQYLDEEPVREFWAKVSEFKEYDGARGAKAGRRPSYYLANNFWLTTSGHFHTEPFLDAIEQIGEDRVLFSVDYPPYEQMSSAARWFDDAQFSNVLKLKVGRENANRLFTLNLKTVSSAVATSFAA